MHDQKISEQNKVKNGINHGVIAVSGAVAVIIFSLTKQTRENK